jgi:hypothetical protein
VEDPRIRARLLQDVSAPVAVHYSRFAVLRTMTTDDPENQLVKDLLFELEMTSILYKQL